MADLSLFLTSATVSMTQNMDTDKVPAATTDCETLEIGDPLESRAKVRIPKRTIYFASGETMEEYSTDEEEEEQEVQDLVRRDVATIDPAKLTWGPYFWFQMWRMATSTISVCDYMGEKLASLFGITTPKYQYAIDEYYRMKKEEMEEEEENRLSEEAECHFAEQNSPKCVVYPKIQQPEPSVTSFVNVSFELEPESSLTLADADRVPSALPS